MSPFRPTPFELWLSPNVGSDFRQLFTHPETWATTRSRLHGFMLGGLNVLIDADSPDRAKARVGENHWQNVVASGMFARLAEWQLPLVVELYGGEGGLASVHQCHARVTAAGGHMAAISLDQRDAQASAIFLYDVRSMTGAMVGVIEGYPSIPAAAIRARVEQLIDGYSKPSFLHLDIDIYGVRDQGIREAKFGEDLRDLAAYCTEQEIVLGVIATAGRTKSSKQFAADTQAFIARVRGHLGRNPDRWLVQSWWEDSAKGDDDFSSPKTRPHNAPDSDPTSLTGVARSLRDA